jgi:hypothetical protein
VNSGPQLDSNMGLKKNLRNLIFKTKVGPEYTPSLFNFEHTFLRKKPTFSLYSESKAFGQVKLHIMILILLLSYQSLGESKRAAFLQIYRVLEPVIIHARTTSTLQHVQKEQWDSCIQLIVWRTFQPARPCQK